MRSVSRKAASVAVLSLCMTLSLAGPAWAGPPGGMAGRPPQGGKAADEPDEIASKVSYTSHNVPETGGSPMAPAAGADWEPPACWYEPRFTPAEFSAYISKVDGRHGEASRAEGGLGGKYDDLHQGDKGSWYQMRYDDDPDADIPKACTQQDGYVFIRPGDPAPADAPVLDPEILAGLAYNRTKLPAPPLTLSPKPGHQVVNLPTHARFTKKLDRVWVTAAIDAAGLDLAATTVAEPSALRLEAGTDEAEPSSCTYDLKGEGKGDGNGGTYTVDTEKSDCNITYRRSTAKGEAHTLKAYLTWKVTWTEGADPDGAPQHPMPDGESAAELPVMVKEIQSVNRD